MTKKIGLLLLTVIAVIAVISVVGVVSAQSSTPEPAPQAQPGQPMPTTAGGILPQLVQVVATDLDMQPQDLLQQLRGQTLAQIIQSRNGDMTKITADIAAAVTTTVNQAVTDGRLTQDRADQILGNLSTTIQNALNGQGPFGLGGQGDFGGFGGRDGNQGPRGFGGRGFGGGQFFSRPGVGGVGQGALDRDIRPLLQAVADATKLTPQQIAQEMRQQNETLAQVITAHGGDVATIVNNAVMTATQRLDQFRQNGTLTQDQETDIINGLKAFYTATLNGAFHIQRNAQPQGTPEASGTI